MALDPNVIIGVIEEYASGLDPAARETINLVREIIDDEIERAKADTTPFRLADLLPWLRSYRFVRKNPWVIPVGIGAMLLGVAGAGAAIMKRIS